MIQLANLIQRDDHRQPLLLLDLRLLRLLLLLRLLRQRLKRLLDRRLLDKNLRLLRRRLNKRLRLLNKRLRLLVRRLLNQPLRLLVRRLLNKRLRLLVRRLLNQPLRLLVRRLLLHPHTLLMPRVFFFACFRKREKELLHAFQRKCPFTGYLNKAYLSPRGAQIFFSFGAPCSVLPLRLLQGQNQSFPFPLTDASSKLPFSEPFTFQPLLLLTPFHKLPVTEEAQTIWRPDLAQRPMRLFSPERPSMVSTASGSSWKWITLVFFASLLNAVTFAVMSRPL